MSANQKPSDVLQQMISKIHSVMGLMGLFEESRPSEKAYTHLEEAMMWLQIMAHNFPLKPMDQEAPVENSVSDAVAELVLD